MAESLEPGVRVVDVARRHGVIANQLSDWRRQVRDDILVLPFAAATTPSEHDGVEPAFVPLGIVAESRNALFAGHYEGSRNWARFASLIGRC